MSQEIMMQLLRYSGCISVSATFRTRKCRQACVKNASVTSLCLSSKQMMIALALQGGAHSHRSSRVENRVPTTSSW